MIDVTSFCLNFFLSVSLYDPCNIKDLMHIKIVLLVWLASLSLALELRAHNYYYNPNYYQPYNKTQETDGGAAAAFFIIVIVVLIIGCSYFCCKRLFNRNPNQFSRPNIINPPYNPNYNAGPPLRPPPYSPAPPQYQQSFRQPVQGSIVNPNRASNPYITSVTDRLNQTCDMCSIKNKIGE